MTEMTQMIYSFGIVSLVTNYLAQRRLTDVTFIVKWLYGKSVARYGPIDAAHIARRILRRETENEKFKRWFAKEIDRCNRLRIRSAHSITLPERSK